MIVAVVGREQGRVLALRGGRLEQIADRTEETPGRHDQGGWSQSRYQRHIENLEHEHYKSVVEELERLLPHARSAAHRRRLPATRRAPSSPDVLSAEIADAVIGWTNAEAHASEAELHEVVQPFVEEWRAGRESEVVERWREEVGKNARGSAGWADTLEAASDGRVEPLLHQPGVQRDAYRCPACGRAAVTRDRPARSTERRWSRATTGSTSPSA